MKKEAKSKKVTTSNKRLIGKNFKEDEKMNPILKKRIYGHFLDSEETEKNSTIRNEKRKSHVILLVGDSCANNGACEILNSIVSKFFSFWMRQNIVRRNFPKPELRKKGNSAHYNPKRLKAFFKNQQFSFFIVREKGAIQEFYMNPHKYLKENRFDKMLMLEQIMALAFLVQRGELVRNLECYCGYNLRRSLDTNNLAKPVCHYVDFYFKRYMYQIFKKVLPEIRRQAPHRIKMNAFLEKFEITNILYSKENDQSNLKIDNKDLLNLNLNSLKHKKKLVKEFSSIESIKRFFSKKKYKDNFKMIKEDYDKERIRQIYNFLSRFNSKNIEEIIHQCFLLLKESTFNFFFTPEDFFLGYKFLFELLLND